VAGAAGQKFVTRASHLKVLTLVDTPQGEVDTKTTFRTGFRHPRLHQKKRAPSLRGRTGFDGLLVADVHEPLGDLLER